MNQILQEEQRRFLQGTGKISRTHDILDQLQEKMAGYHERKRTEEQLLMSQQEPPQPPKTKSTFKLFTKTNPNPNNINSMNILQLDQSHKSRGKGQVGQLLQQVQAIQQLVRKKLALKEERVGQLEREVQLAGQEKVHLYKINCQLEQEIFSLTKDQAEQEKRKKLSQEELQCELKTLKQIYENKKTQNKRLRKEEELLKQTLKQTQQRRKNYHESQIKIFKSQSRSNLPQKQDKPQEQEKYLRALVGELDKLRKMVRTKMKKSQSRGRIR